MLLAVFAGLAVQLTQDSARLAQAADRILAQGTAGLAGAALVVVQGNRIVLSKGYGTAGRSGDVDPARTLFRAASVGKLFVATAAVQLAAAGKLSLDADIAAYLPELELASHGRLPVTMRQLLSHTAGVEDQFTGSIELAGPTPTALGDYFRRYPPKIGSPPGQQINYSNLGAALAGLVVERVAGRPFGEVVATSIFAPLRMKRSFYTEPLPPELRADVAGDTSMMRYRLIPYPAGSLVTTPLDMAHFLGAHLNGGRFGGGRILDSVHTVLMQTRTWSANPDMPGIALGFFETESNRRRVLFHTGSRGHHSAFVLVPEKRFGFYLVLDAQEEIASGLIDQMTEALLGQTWSADTTSRHSTSIDEQYSGRYRLNAGARHSFEALAKLGMGDVIVSRDSGGIVLHRERPMPLVIVGDDLFRTSDGMFVAFHRAAGGSVDRMHASGRLMDGVSLDRLAWWENSTFHRIALGGTFLVALITTIGALISAAWRRLRKRERARSAWPRRGYRLAAAAFSVSPLPAVITLLTARDATVVELAPAVAVVRWLLLLAVTMGLGAAVAVALGRGGSRPYRIGDAAFATVAAVATALLHYWRALPLGG